MNAEAQKIQDYLEVTLSDNPEEIIQRIKDLSVYMARSGQMLAEAKKKLRDEKSSKISKAILEIAKQNRLSAKAQNALVESIAQE